MRKLPRSLVPFLGLTAVLLAPAAVQAQATRTWVSGVGNDANPCSRTAPCKTFSGAISKTLAGGEISVLDPGGFGAVTINKALTINGDGTLAGILASSGNGIIVSAGANERVVLRNISINGAGSGTNGIRYLSGKSLTVDNVSISGFTANGIDMHVTASAKLIVRNTSITNAASGLFITTTVGQAQASLDNVHLTGLGNGIEVSTNGRAMISDSVISSNTSNGLLASAATSRLIAEGCQIAFNDVAGVNAFGNGSHTRLSNNEIYNNATGISISAGAIVESTADNRVFDTGPTSPPNGVITIE